MADPKAKQEQQHPPPWEQSPSHKIKDQNPHEVARGLDAASSDTTKQVRQEETTEYILWPKDGTDKTAVRNTQNNIKNITGLSEIFSYRNHDPEPEGLTLWVVSATATQLDSIKKDAGIHSVEENISGELEATIPSP